MAVGTSAGLFDSSDDRPQAVFKHAVLDRYLGPFIGMTGSQVAGGRVVILDGYAGEGRYETGEPASAERILQTAEKFHRRQVEPYFVELKRSSFTKLETVVGEYRERGVRAIARRGQVHDHLDDVLAWIRGPANG